MLSEEKEIMLKNICAPIRGLARSEAVSKSQKSHNSETVQMKITIHNNFIFISYNEAVSR